MGKLIRFLKDKKGATMVEYALMVGLIATVCAGVVAVLGSAVQGIFQEVIGGF